MIYQPKYIKLTWFHTQFSAISEYDLVNPSSIHTEV